MPALFSPVSLGSNIAKGYSLSKALELVSSCGFEYVEIASIAGVCEHIAPGDINGDFIQSVKDMLASAGLKAYAFAGHVDLTDEKETDDFLKKIELAAGIGCRLINTNSGPVSRMAQFRENMIKVIEKAERCNIKVCLESHGDIIETAQQAACVLREINHPLIRMNYDTGNTLYYAKGAIKLEEDILYASEFIEYIHLKDIRIDGDRVDYCPLGKGCVNFGKIFDSIKQFERNIGCGLEIPVFITGDFNALNSTAAPLGEDDIRAAAAESMEFLKTVI